MKRKHESGTLGRPRKKPPNRRGNLGRGSMRVEPWGNPGRRFPKGGETLGEETVEEEA